MRKTIKLHRYATIFVCSHCGRLYSVPGLFSRYSFCSNCASVYTWATNTFSEALERQKTILG